MIPARHARAGRWPVRLDTGPARAYLAGVERESASCTGAGPWRGAEIGVGRLQAAAGVFLLWLVFFILMGWTLFTA